MSFKKLKIFFKVHNFLALGPQLTSKLLVTPACLQCASDWPRTFLHPRYFCSGYHYFLFKSTYLAAIQGKVQKQYSHNVTAMNTSMHNVSYTPARL